MEVALKRASTGLDRARLLKACASPMVVRCNYVAAADLGLQALAALGMPLPPQSEWPQMLAPLEAKIAERVGDRPIAEVVASLPASTTIEDVIIGGVGATAPLLFLNFPSISMHYI
jgi:hypothetical protein